MDHAIKHQLDQAVLIIIFKANYILRTMIISLSWLILLNDIVIHQVKKSCQLQIQFAP